MHLNFFRKLKLESILLKLAPLVPDRFPHFSQYSDFFPFVNNSTYTTILYALNYSFFLQPQSRKSELVVISLFDLDGCLFHEFSCNLDANLLFTPINLSSHLPLNSFGSFTIRHIFDHSLSTLSPVFADRSYISFANLVTKFQHFVHGNQDSVVFSKDPKLSRYLRPSLVPRFYRPQFIFKSNCLYTLVFSNPTNIHLFFILRCKSYNSMTFYRACIIPPLGTKFFRILPHHSSFYITIVSNHPFPRPLIMTGGIDQISDIFHS